MFISIRSEKGESNKKRSTVQSRIMRTYVRTLTRTQTHLKTRKTHSLKVRKCCFDF